MTCGDLVQMRIAGEWLNGIILAHSNVHGYHVYVNRELHWAHESDIRRISPWHYRSKNKPKDFDKVIIHTDSETQGAIWNSEESHWCCQNGSTLSDEDVSGWQYMPEWIDPPKKWWSIHHSSRKVVLSNQTGWFLGENNSRVWALNEKDALIQWEETRLLVSKLIGEGN